MCRFSWNLGVSVSWNPMALSRHLMGLLYLYIVRCRCNCALVVGLFLFLHMYTKCLKERNIQQVTKVLNKICSNTCPIIYSVLLARHWLAVKVHFPSFFNSHSGPGPRLWDCLITLRHTTHGRTPLEEWAVRRRDLYVTKHNTHKRQNIHAPSVSKLQSQKPTYPTPIP